MDNESSDRSQVDIKNLKFVHKWHFKNIWILIQAQYKILTKNMLNNFKSISLISIFRSNSAERSKAMKKKKRKRPSTVRMRAHYPHICWTEKTKNPERHWRSRSNRRSKTRPQSIRCPFPRSGCNPKTRSSGRSRAENGENLGSGWSPKSLTFRKTSPANRQNSRDSSVPPVWDSKRLTWPIRNWRPLSICPSSESNGIRLRPCTPVWGSLPREPSLRSTSANWEWWPPAERSFGVNMLRSPIIRKMTGVSMLFCSWVNEVFYILHSENKIYL